MKKASGILWNPKREDSRSASRVSLFVFRVQGKTKMSLIWSNSLKLFNSAREPKVWNTPFAVGPYVGLPHHEE